MRAVTGTIVSSQPCPAAKVPRVLERFLEEVGSDILSSDAATYLRTAIEAAAELNLFRRDLRRRQQLGSGGEIASERKHRRAPVEEDDGRWEPKAEEEDGRWEPKVEEEDGEYGMTAPAAGEKKSSNTREEPREEKRYIAAPEVDLRSPSSEKKRRKKKEKGVKEETETEYAVEKQSRKALGAALQGTVSEEGTGSGNKSKKKKKHIKQEEEEASPAKEAEPKMVHPAVAENGLASGEKKRKKRRHTEEEEVMKEIVDGGDLGSDKKRKKKRGRDGDVGNDTELVEHKHKKQRK